MYFFSLYGSSSAGSFVILRCVGIFVSATLPVLIIMVPKFTVIQYKNITGKNLWAASKNLVDMIGSNSKSKDSHIEVAAIIMKDTASLKRSMSNAPRVLPVGASDAMDAGDIAGVGSCKTFCSSGSRKQSSKALLNPFGCADMTAPSDIVRTGNSTYKIPTNADADDEGILETNGHHTTSI